MPRKPAARGGRERRHRCCHGNTSGGDGTAHGRRRHNTTASSLAPSAHPSTTTSGGPTVGSCGAPASIGNRLRRRRGEERDGGKTLSPSLAQGASRAPRVAQCAPSSLAAQLLPTPAAVEGGARTNDAAQLRAAAPPTHVSGLKKAPRQNFTAREWLRIRVTFHQVAPLAQTRCAETARFGCLKQQSCTIGLTDFPQLRFAAMRAAK